MKRSDSEVKWKEVRELYPDKFVKFEVVESHTEDGKEAMKEFVNCKPGQLVYSTKNEQLIIQLNVKI